MRRSKKSVGRSFGHIGALSKITEIGSKHICMDLNEYSYYKYTRKIINILKR